MSVDRVTRYAAASSCAEWRHVDDDDDDDEKADSSSSGTREQTRDLIMIWRASAQSIYRRISLSLPLSSLFTLYSQLVALPWTVFSVQGYTLIFASFTSSCVSRFASHKTVSFQESHDSPDKACVTHSHTQARTQQSVLPSSWHVCLPVSLDPVERTCKECTVYEQSSLHAWHASFSLQTLELTTDSQAE